MLDNNIVTYHSFQEGSSFYRLLSCNVGDTEAQVAALHATASVNEG